MLAIDALAPPSPVGPDPIPPVTLRPTPPLDSFGPTDRTNIGFTPEAVSVVQSDATGRIWIADPAEIRTGPGTGISRLATGLGAETRGV